jgi:hypothetical protein
MIMPVTPNDGNVIDACCTTRMRWRWPPFFAGS